MSASAAKEPNLGTAPGPLVAERQHTRQATDELGRLLEVARG
ncbi:MAG: hypothetical protein WB869_10630 [Candidatus Acidiferrales bacterium]